MAMLYLSLVTLLVQMTACKDHNQPGSDVKSQADTLISNFLQEKKFDTAFVAILDGKKLVYRDVISKKDSEEVNADTLVPILDISKTITAVAVLQLVESEVIDLQHKPFTPTGILGDVLYVKPNEQVLDITIEDLLRHSGGWDESKNPILDNMENPITLTLTSQMPELADFLDYDGPIDQYGIMEYMLTHPVTFKPGTKVVHSNFGYLVLGRIIEEAAGESYHKYVKKHILNEAGMWHTQLGPSRSEEQKIHQRRFDQEGNLKHSPEVSLDSDMPFILDSTQGWYSTISDVSRFFLTLFDSEVLLKKHTLEHAVSRLHSFEEHHPFSWPGLAMNIRKNGAMELEVHNSDLGCNVHVYKEPSFNFTEGKSGQKLLPPGVKLLTFIGFTNHNRKHVRRLADDLLDLDFSTTSQNAFVHDMYDLQLASNSEHILLKSHLSEHHIIGYTNAMKMTGYYPIWIHGYSDQVKSYYVTVFAKANTYEQLLYKITTSKSKAKLWQFAAQHSKDGYQVTFLQSFVSASHGGDLTHTLLMQKQAAIHEVLFDFFKEMKPEFVARYMTHLQAEGFAPVVQSIDRQNHKLYMSYILHKPLLPGLAIVTKSYQKLSFDQLHRMTRRRVKQGYSLTYIDAYRHPDGRIQFSCIFTKGPNVPAGWAIQTDIPSENLYNEVITWSASGYLPKYIVAFTRHQSLYYVVYWERI